MSAEHARGRIGAALDAIDADHDVLRETASDVVGNDFRVEVAERLEYQDRTNRGLMYRTASSPVITARFTIRRTGPPVAEPTRTISFSPADVTTPRPAAGEWCTEVAGDGRLGWTDGLGPPETDRAHHPDELLRGDPDPPDTDEG